MRNRRRGYLFWNSNQVSSEHKYLALPLRHSYFIETRTTKMWQAITFLQVRCSLRRSWKRQCVCFRFLEESNLISEEYEPKGMCRTYSSSVKSKCMPLRPVLHFTAGRSYSCRSPNVPSSPKPVIHCSLRQSIILLHFYKSFALVFTFLNILCFVSCAVWFPTCFITRMIS